MSTGTPRSGRITGMNDFDGTYSSTESTKRRAEVLERLRGGMSEKKIATDLGIPAYAVSQIAQSLRQEGALGQSAPPLPPPGA